GSVYTETAGGAAIVGGWLSVTITFCWQVAVLPEASVAVQMMQVVPTGYGSVVGLPSLRAAEAVAPGQLSATAGVLIMSPVTVAEHLPSSAFTFTSAGQVIVGFS